MALINPWVALSCAVVLFLIEIEAAVFFCLTICLVCPYLMCVCLSLSVCDRLRVCFFLFFMVCRSSITHAVTASRPILRVAFLFFPPTFMYIRFFYCWSVRLSTTCFVFLLDTRSPLYKYKYMLWRFFGKCLRRRRTQSPLFWSSWALPLTLVTPSPFSTMVAPSPDFVMVCPFA